MRYLNLVLFSLLLYLLSCGTESGKLYLKEFIVSLGFEGQHIVVIDMDKCASCHFKSILDLCAMDCPGILLLVYSGSRAKKNILMRDCKNASTGNLNLTFFSDKEAMDMIRQDADISMYLLSIDSKKNININNITRVDEVFPYCD